MEKVCLLGVADSNYLHRYAVSVTSLLEHTGGLDVKLLAVDCARSETAAMASYFASAFPRVSFECFELTPAQREVRTTWPSYRRPVDGRHVTDVTLCKFAGLETLKRAGYDAALYMDPDVLVTRDVGELVHAAAEVQLLGAVRSHAATSASGGEVLLDSFNAGVLAVNLRALTFEDVAEYNSLAGTHDERTCDQYIINRMYLDNYEELPRTFNSARRFDHTAAVFHFTGPRKPWACRDFTYDTRFRTYFDYVAARVRSFKRHGLKVNP